MKRFLQPRWNQGLPRPSRGGLRLVLSLEGLALVFLLALILEGLAPPAWAQWGAATQLGSANNKVSGTNNLVMTVTAAVAVGEVIIVCVAADNTGTTDGDLAEVTISDSKGNTYTKAKEFTNGQGAAAAGATAHISFSKAATALVSGTDTITVTLSAARIAKAVIAEKRTIGAGNVVSVAGSGSVADDGVDPSAITISGLASREYLWVRSTAMEALNTEPYATSTNYTAFSTTLNGTTGGGSASNMSVRGEDRVFTGTSDTTDPTWGVFDAVSVMVALKEAAPGGAPKRLPLLGVG